MKLSKDVINDISNMCQHFIDNGELSKQELQERDAIVSLCTKVNWQTGLELNLYPIVEHTNDLIVNLMAREILRLEEIEVDATELMNAYTEYLQTTYNFDGEQHPYCWSATTDECLNYCAHYVNALRCD